MVLVKSQLTTICPIALKIQIPFCNLRTKSATTASSECISLGRSAKDVKEVWLHNALAGGVCSSP